MPSPDRADAPRLRPTRRAILGSILAALASGAGARGADPEQAPGRGPADVDAEALLAHCRKAGLDGARIDRGGGRRFAAIGDAPAQFSRTALGICESLADSFLDHFKSRGFAVEVPAGRLNILTLAGPKSYAAILGADPGPAMGHYDLDTNVLVMFDFRSKDSQVAQAEAANRLTLIHEASHQLCFNAGLLDRAADVPVVISEGLATYCEPWSPRTRKGIGAVNLGRSQSIRPGLDEATAWLPLEKLLEDDGSFKDERTRLLAYSESWLLLRALMKDAPRRARLKAYLAAMNLRRTAEGRLEEAETHLGDLAKLDRELRKAAGMRPS